MRMIEILLELTCLKLVSVEMELETNLTFCLFIVEFNPKSVRGKEKEK